MKKKMDAKMRKIGCFRHSQVPKKVVRIKKLTLQTRELKKGIIIMI